jgi:hypothetical protein
MKNLKFLQILILLVSLSSCSSCEEEEWTTLPPETQTGANTFGCYVNGELFVKVRYGALLMAPPLQAIYSATDNNLLIYCEGFLGKNDCSIELKIDNPQELINNDFSVSMHIQNISCWRSVCKNEGFVYLTKFDTLRSIVSGTFDFTTKCDRWLSSYETKEIANPNDSSFYVKSGRFDIKLEIYNN